MLSPGPAHLIFPSLVQETMAKRKGQVTNGTHLMVLTCVIGQLKMGTVPGKKHAARFQCLKLNS